MQSFQDYLQKFTEEHETSATKAIRNGLGINKDFWDNFILLLNDAEAVSDLLNVPVEKVGTWYDSIKSNLEKVHDSDKEVVPKDKKRLLKTGLPEEI